MGANLQICQSHRPDLENEETISDIDFQGNFEKLQDQIQKPPISQELSDLISAKKPYFKELNRIQHPRMVHFRGGLYLGEISKFRSPQGWGKLYCKNGDVIIGEFSNGDILGKCFFGKQNGTYYQGEVTNGKLNCQQGTYYCPEFQYVGGFKDNEYEGHGRILKNNFILQGDFKNGIASSGKLEWKENGESYIYTGEFNEKMEIHGKGNFILIAGTIEEPYGTYSGQFQYNKKEGQGEYEYLNGNIYRGHYVAGKKHGYGELFSQFDELLYKGEWINDVPEKNPQILLNSPNVMKRKKKCTLKRVDTLRSSKTETAVTSDSKL